MTNKSRRGRVPSAITSLSRARMMRANAEYQRLTDEEREQWRLYAATLTAIDPKTRLAKPRQGDKVFVGLTCRFLHVHAAGTPVPRLPPSFPFAGDHVTVTAQSTQNGVLWTASGPTSAGVVVELLLQSLPSPVRSPQPGRYRTQVFAAFAEGALSVETPLVVGGWFIPAFRFVELGTGQDTPLVVLPKVTVE